MHGELLQGEAGISKTRAAVGVGAAAATLGIAVAAFNILGADGSPEPTGADKEQKEQTQEWFDIRGLARPDCLEIVDQAGTALTKEIVVDGKKVTFIVPQIGADMDVVPQGATPDANQRYNTNSFSSPFINTEPEKMETEAKATICESADFAVAFANMVGNMTNGTGQRIAEVEGGEWLKKWADMTPEQLNDKANRLLGLDLKTSDVLEHASRYQEHQDLAENLAAILDNTTNLGIGVGATEIDYSYGTKSAEATVFGVPEIVKSEDQFPNARALTFAATEKGQKCVQYIFGFNAGIGNNVAGSDKRPETFKPVEECDTTPTTGGETTTTRRGRGSTTTTRPNGSTTTSWRTSNTVTGNTVIEQPGAGGDPDPDNDPDNNTTTSIAPSSSTTNTTIRLGDPSTTTTAPQTECTTPACQ